MKQEIVVMHMSGAYLSQDFYKKEKWQVQEVDCRNIAGTNCYCDDMAKDELRKELKEYGPEGIHFLDSGNYHYLSLLWLEKIKEPFSLVVFDHHPDMQPPSFGAITSCGGWVKEAIEKNSNLQHVYLVGVDENLLRDLLGIESKEELGKAWQKEYPKVYIGLDALEQDEHPIYISFDKDVLSEEYCRCDWDQGNLSLEEAERYLQQVKQTHRLIGMDVCGENSQWDSLDGLQYEKTIAINQKTNGRLVELVCS